MSNAAVRVRTTSSARRKPVPLLFDIVEERLDATDRRALYSEAKSLFRAGQEHAKRKEGISSSLEFFVSVLHDFRRYGPRFLALTPPALTSCIPTAAKLFNLRQRARHVR